MSGLFQALAEVLTDKVCVIWGERRLTGHDLLGGVERAARILCGAGVQTGDRVLVQVEKSLDNVFVYLACLRIGAIYVPLNTGYRAKEFAYFVANATPRLVVCDPSSEHQTANSLTLAADGSGTFYQAPSADVSSTFPSPTDLAAIVYTSGTTGRPKGAMLGNANLLHNARALAEVWGIGSSDTLLHALPLYHIHGLFIALNTTLLAGGCLHMHDRFDAKTVIQALPTCTLLMGVPTFYTRLLKEPGFTAETTRNIRLFISGSAPLLMETFDEFKARTGRDILERYGMSECGIITSNPRDGIRRGTVGRPLPNTQVRITDKVGDVGSVEVKGPGVFCGYWQMPEKNQTEFRPDGFFITGDLGQIDGDGYLTLIGRAKDLIITGGLNVYPSEIEAVINALPGVDESAVIGLPHDDFGEAVTAVICLKDGASSTEAGVIAALKQDLAAFKVPKRVFYATALPRNAMGKVEKAALRAQYAATFKT